MPDLEIARVGTIATLDADNRMALAGIEAQYKKELQASQSMAATYQSMVDSFSRVMLSPDLDKDAKIKVTGDLTQLYKNSLAMQSDVSGLKLGELLAFEPKGGTTTTTLTPAPAPAPGRPDLRDDLLGGWENPGGA